MLVLLAVAWADPPDTDPLDPPGDLVPPQLSPPIVREAASPPYPDGQTGPAEVRVRLTIDANGRVAGAKIVSPPQPGFDEAVLGVASGWTFEPARDANGPIGVVVELSVPFAAPIADEPRSEGEDAVITVVGRVERPATVHAVSIEEVRRIPGTFGDPVRVITSLPGAARPTFGGGALVIRGSNPEDTGIYVEGVRVPDMFHIGGFESVLAPEMIGSVDYLPGDYGVEFGRSTGGVVNVRLNPKIPEKPTFRWSTDILDTGLYGSFTVGDHQIAIGARRSYIDALLALLPGDGAVAAPRWSDAQVRWRWKLSDRWTTDLFLLGYDDALVVTLPRGAFGGDLNVHLRSARAIASATGVYGDSTFDLVAAFGTDRDGIELGDTLSGNRVSDLGQLRLSWTERLSPALTTVVGVDSTGGRAGFVLDSDLGPKDSAIEENVPIDDDLVTWAWDPGVYLRAEWRPLPERRDMLLFEPGVRLDASAIAGKTSIGVDPRLGVRWKPWPSTAVKLAGGRYSQPPPVEERVHLDGSSTGAGLERAYTSSLGITEDIPRILSLGATGYYKWMDDQVVRTGGFLDGGFENTGVGRAYGVEVIVRRALADGLFGWVSYTLSRSERRDTDDAAWYPFDYDQTHNLVLVASYEVPRVVTLGVKGQYTTGNPYTPNDGGTWDVDAGDYVPQSAAENSARQDAYSAVSVRIEHAFPLKHGRASLYLDLINVVHGKNPEATLYNYDYTERAPLPSLGFIPSLGFDLEVGP